MWYINTGVWLAQNFFVYLKNTSSTQSSVFFLHIVQPTKYTILICIIQTESSFLFCVSLQSHGDDKTCPNLPELIFILHQQNVEEKKKTCEL